MISVVEVYNAVRDLANKDQKGFISPKVFNSFAAIAQENVYMEMYSELTAAYSLRARGADASQGESAYRGVEDDLSRYIVEEVLSTSSDSSITGDSNVFRKPGDFCKLISIRVNDDERTQAELVYNSSKMSHILNSKLSAPTDLFPVALVAKNIEMFPTSVGSVIMTYYRQPGSVYASGVGEFSLGEVDYSSKPRLAINGDLIDTEGFFVPDIANSRNFDLPARYIGEVIAEICKMIGVRLRDTVIAQYSAQETQVK